MSNQELSRSEQTKKVIEEAFLDLCLEVESIDVSVSKVVARAKVSRSTFYMYYEDIYSLIETIQNHLLSNFKIKISRAIPVFLANTPNEAASHFIPMAAFLSKNKRAILVFMGKNGSTQFIYKFKQLAKEQLIEIFSTRSNKYTDYILEYMVSANLRLMVYWLENNQSLSYEELTSLITTIVFKGPLAAGKIEG